MGNLQQKGAKEPAYEAARHAADLRERGYTVFRFDFAPKFIRRNLSLGDAFRELKRLTGYKVAFWRCPVRGMAVRYHSPPTTTHIHDKGDSWILLDFSTKADEAEAKRELVLNVVLVGIGLFRGLPNAIFEEQTSIIRNLLTAPASASQDEWLELKARLHPKIEPLLKTHQAELRQNLL